MSSGRNKEPVKLIIAKGKKHLTKAEIKEREDNEIKVNATNVTPPNYLSKKQQEEFKKIADILLDIGIMSELDEECLAHYLISNTNYITYTKKLKSLNNMLSKTKDEKEISKIMSEIDLYLKYQDRALNQSRACANDMGLSISSRCKLVAPQSKESPKQNKFKKFEVIG